MEKITDKIAALPPDGNYFSLEFFPPKTQMGFANLQVRLDRMARALRPLFVTVTWGAAGSTAGKSLALAEVCQRQLGLTTCLHLTCTNMSRRLVDEALEQAKALGIRNILALRGDAPRSDEYRANGADGTNGDGASDDDDSNREFQHAVDLVRYIRQMHGDYFCVGVAAYPEGHADDSHPAAQDPQLDLPYLVEKTQAGADFIMTQLFYDVNAFMTFETLLRSHSSGAFAHIPIIAGLMPVQSYQILRRTAKLSHASLPPDVLARLDAVRGDDAAVKAVGVDVLSEMVAAIQRAPRHTTPGGPRGFHFYTLNLEKAVTHILERCDLLPATAPDDDEDGAENGAAVTAAMVDSTEADQLRRAAKERRRLSSANSAPRNRVVVERAASSSARSRASLEVAEDEAGVPRDPVESRANTLAISEGEGSLGREATWDDFPNGRWGDARSPAYGEIDGYGISLHASPTQAIRLWGHPTTRADLTALFRRHVDGTLAAIPWSEEGLTDESVLIRAPLLRLNARGWWTVASQPAVDGARSSDPAVGWGPRGARSGFVFQKPFVEFFLPAADWERLRPRLEREGEDVSYFAGNVKGEFVAADEAAVNPVTWGAFAGKEIITPTIIEAVSFRAWLDDAFTIWRVWQAVYPPGSPTARLLADVRADYWLVNVIHHNYVEKDALWDMLLEE